MAQMNISTEKKLIDLENRLAVAKGKRDRMVGSRGLIDADYCLWNGEAMRSCCIALGTMSNHLWWIYTCMCNRVTTLYSRKLTEHYKPAIMEKLKIIKKIINSIKKRERENSPWVPGRYFFLSTQKFSPGYLDKSIWIFLNRRLGVSWRPSVLRIQLVSTRIWVRPTYPRSVG